MFVLKFAPFSNDVDLNQTTIPLGAVTLDAHGRAFFDGAPLESFAHDELSRKCQVRLRGEG